jgi:hypothetical protein
VLWCQEILSKDSKAKATVQTIGSALDGTAKVLFSNDPTLTNNARELMTFVHTHNSTTPHLHVVVRGYHIRHYRVRDDSNAQRSEGGSRSRGKTHYDYRSGKESITDFSVSIDLAPHTTSSLPGYLRTYQGDRKVTDVLADFAADPSPVKSFEVRKNFEFPDDDPSVGELIKKHLFEELGWSQDHVCTEACHRGTGEHVKCEKTTRLRITFPQTDDRIFVIPPGWRTSFLLKGSCLSQVLCCCCTCFGCGGVNVDDHKYSVESHFLVDKSRRDIFDAIKHQFPAHPAQLSDSTAKQSMGFTKLQE